MCDGQEEAHGERGQEAGNVFEWPWSALGLESGAQAGQVRAAYAKALKRIDQQRDMAGFQALREARDEALELIAGREGDRAGAASAPSGRQVSAGPRSVEGGSAQDAIGAMLQPLDNLLDNPWTRVSLASWTRMLDERPLMSERQAYAFERRIVLALDDWLDQELLPAHEVFLLLDSAFGWSSIRSNLGDFLPRMRERRLRTIIGSLRG